MDALATEPHFLDHIAPVWRALPGRRTLWVPHILSGRARDLDLDHVALGRPPLSGTPTLVASYGDAKKARRAFRPVVMMEHGAGQSYVGLEGTTGSYVGSDDRAGVKLVLVPNATAAARHRAAHPDIPAVVIGSPHLDDLARHPRPTAGVPTISFHWDCRLAPETRSAWTEYRPALGQLAAAFPGARGHAHPRLWRAAVPGYLQHGLTPTRDFADVVTRSSVYVCDNSSTLFTFAALARPVVVLNSRHYRRDVDHGGRFWDWADVGVQCDHPDDLVDAVALALTDPPEVATRRRAITAEVYPHRGQAAARAVAAIEEVFAHA